MDDKKLTLAEYRRIVLRKLSGIERSQAESVTKSDQEHNEIRENITNVEDSLRKEIVDIRKELAQLRAEFIAYKERTGVLGATWFIIRTPWRVAVIVFKWARSRG